MASFVDVSCLYSTIRNASGKRRHFAYLPPHGRTLNVNEEFSVFGHITQAVVLDMERATSRHHMAAFERAVESGDLEIVSTPAPLLRDTDTDETQMLTLATGSLSAIDPCWAGTVEDSEDPYQPV